MLSSLRNRFGNSGAGSGGRLRLAVLLATIAAALLVPAGQAFAAEPEVPHLKLNIVGTGSGKVESDPFERIGDPLIECSYNGSVASGVCENTPEEEISEGEEYFFDDLIATPAPGSEFVGWTIEKGRIPPSSCPRLGIPTRCNLFTGSGTTEGSDWEVTAEFAIIASHLTVHVNGATGSGTVTSAPTGINCSAGSECSAELEGLITLTAHPATGYAIAGWIGCKQTGATTCSVAPTVQGEENEVTAIFIKEGSQGQQGNPGAKGDTGAAGSQGAKGDTGAAGSQGPAGAQGPAGPQGPAGKVNVTCKVKGKKVTCTVKNAAKSSSTQSLHWRLMHGGHAYSHGASPSGELQLDLRHTPAGRYRLHIQGQKASRLIVVG